jgi:hypothetical protein
MPGFRRWHPSEEPFSYTKLCFYYLPCMLLFLGLAAMLVSAFGKLQWLDRLGEWLPSSIPLGIAIGAVFIGAYDLFFMKVLWKLLPASVRARIPYDAKEASESKGDIKSFWDLRKLWSSVSSAS